MLLKSKLRLGCFLDIEDFVKETEECEAMNSYVKAAFKSHPPTMKPDEPDSDDDEKVKRSKIKDLELYKKGDWKTTYPFFDAE